LSAIASWNESPDHGLGIFDALQVALAEGEAKLRTWETRLEGEAQQLRVETERLEIDRAELGQKSQDTLVLATGLEAREAELNQREAESDGKLAQHRVECESKLAQAQAESEAKLAQRQTECEAKLTQRELELLRAWAEFEAAVASEEHEVRRGELDERERAIAAQEAELHLLHNRLRVAARDLRLSESTEQVVAEVSPQPAELTASEHALVERRNRVKENEERIAAAERSVKKRMYELEQQELRLESREAKLAAYSAHALYP
jgi:hypothetical protein